MKYPEIVHAQYQDISQKVQLSIQELLGGNDISPFDVTEIRLITDVITEKAPSGYVFIQSLM